MISSFEAILVVDIIFLQWLIELDPNDRKFNPAVAGARSVDRIGAPLALCDGRYGESCSRQAQ